MTKNETLDILCRTYGRIENILKYISSLDSSTVEELVELMKNEPNCNDYIEDYLLGAKIALSNMIVKIEVDIIKDY